MFDDCGSTAEKCLNQSTCSIIVALKGEKNVSRITRASKPRNLRQVNIQTLNRLKTKQYTNSR